ncbi:unnamed protein product [Phytomonas sp. EM1]|nr:unnamed protein product [Phytomonas sp. EM1]|eukprot:CCW60003.1 unnamed protein product [Phytomonas sp. isolate EM1]
MPRLVVEYAKSGRSTCSASGCGLKIAKHEIRIGSVSNNPFDENAGEIIKWRHLCCFSDVQLKNAEQSGAIEQIEGFESLSSADKDLIVKFQKGELKGKTELIGRLGDVANSPLAEALGAGKRAARKRASEKTPKGSTSPKKAPKKESKEKETPQKREASVDSDATE